MRKIFNAPIKSHWFILLLAGYATTILNISFWRAVLTQIELSHASMILAFASLPFILFGLLTFFFALVIWPYITKPLWAVILVLASAASYMMWQYGAYFDADMVRNVFQTDTREALDLLTFSLFLWVLFFGILPAIWVCKAKITYAKPIIELRNRLILLVLCLISIGVFLAPSYKELSSFGRNNSEIRKLINPTNFIYGTIRYFKIQSDANKVFSKLDPNATLAPFPDEKPTVFIIVLGETARAANFSLNGYAQKTNPNLEKMAIVNFTNVHSCGTATAISVPCMFSDMGRKNFNTTDAKYRESLMDLLQDTGYKTWWRENDGGCKGVCDRIPTENIVAVGNPKYCQKDYCWDEALLDGLEGYLSAVTDDTVIVLHTMGSHGPTYFKRYPDVFKKFTPACDTADMQNCSQQQIVNAYNNTILYTDHIVSSVIHTLQKFPQFESGMLYVSDHGESLGEKGIYLHGLPYAIAPEEQKHIPMILWMSENMKKYDHIDYACLKQQATTQSYTHDNFFHSLVGLLEVDTKKYKQNLDLFEPCRTKALPKAS